MSLDLDHVSSNLETFFLTASRPGKVDHFQFASTDVLRMRSQTSGRVVKSSRTKEWNNDPVLLRTRRSEMPDLISIPLPSNTSACTTLFSLPSRKNE